jgi:hypothetical protein
MKIRGPSAVPGISALALCRNSASHAARAGIENSLMPLPSGHAVGLMWKHLLCSRIWKWKSPSKWSECLSLEEHLHGTWMRHFWNDGARWNWWSNFFHFNLLLDARFAYGIFWILFVLLKRAGYLLCKLPYWKFNCILNFSGVNVEVVALFQILVPLRSCIQYSASCTDTDIRVD